MTVLGLVVALIVVGLLLHLVNNFLAIDPTIKGIINIVIVLAVVLWLLSFFGGPLLFLNRPLR